MSEEAKAVPNGTGEMKKAAAAIAAGLELAWNRGDPGAFAECFSERADVVSMTGSHLSGRDRIATAFGTAFAGPWAKSRVILRVVKVKPLTPDAVVVFLGQTLTLSDGRALTGRVTAVVRRLGDAWKIAVMQTTPARPAASAAKADEDAKASA